MPATPAATLAPAVWRWLGRVPFAETAALQERLRRDVVAGVGAETVLLLEHDPVITLGRAAHDANVLAGEDELARQGVAVHRATRGGDVTYHGPGQLVGYPIVRLRRGVRAHIEGMAGALVEVLAACGIDARYRADAPGLWTRDRVGPETEEDAGGERKICAFGINVHHRVAVHGFALNLDPALSAFRMIVPCGLAGVAVTSLAEVTGRAAPSPEALAPRVADALGRHLGLALTRADVPPDEIASGARGDEDSRADEIATEDSIATMDLA